MPFFIKYKDSLAVILLGALFGALFVFREPNLLNGLTLISSLPASSAGPQRVEVYSAGGQSKRKGW